MGKFLAIFSFFIWGVLLKGYSQSIDITDFDKGPYGNGSTIAVPLILTETSDFFKTGNTFKLYLSDASGSFANEKEIGAYTGFYTTFINGTIPANTPAGNYRVRIKSSIPAVTGQESAQFEIKAENGVQAAIDAPAQQVITGNDDKAFGYCTPGKSNTRFNFTNTSTAGANVTATFINEANASDKRQISFPSSPQQFIPDITHYTIFVTAELNGITGTRAYFLINNVINTPFNPPGSSTVCLPQGYLEYNVETASSNGIQLNFPGNTYQITWGDGNVETYNLRSIKANGSKVMHLYTKSSCGSQITIGSTRYYNVFGIIVQSKGPYCGNIGVPVSSQAKVVTQPENRFSLPSLACLNTPLTINNESLAGEDPGTSSPSCQNNNVIYYWYVDNKPVTPQGVPITYKLTTTFTSPGLHSIRLESESTSECQAAPVEKTLYVQPPPKPEFAINDPAYCINSPVKPVDKSVLDPDSHAEYKYEWIISGPAPATFLNNTTNKSRNPEFSFTTAGIYSIKLSISSVCSTVTTNGQTIIVNSSPVITAAWEANLCGKGQLLTFSNTGGNPVKTSFSGTFRDLSDTYRWTVGGGNYSFENGTGAASKEPSVLFSDYGVYTVSVTHTNNCGSVTETHTITFNESPTINAGTDQTICAGNNVVLNGSITGPPVLSFAWKGGKGTFIPGRDVLTPQYIPSADEISAGLAELSLTAVTMNPAPCNAVTDVMVITINPANKITGPPQKTICTGTSVNYSPKAGLEGSIISWTASATANASGFSSAGNGDITDIITNTDPDNNASVTYTIIPEKNGCQGDVFTLTVTVAPLPVASAVAGNSTICTGQPAGIVLSSNISATSYRWTSTVTGTITGNSNQGAPAAATGIKDILVNNGNTPGTVTYTIVPVTAAGCEGRPVTLSITVSAPPVQANAGIDEKVCNVSTVKLQANNPGAGTGIWTLTSGQAGVTFDDDARFDAVVNGLIPGETYRFQWAISGPFNCLPGSDEVVISVLRPIGSNSISAPLPLVCQGTDFTLDGSLPDGGDGSYAYQWETSTDGNNWIPLTSAQGKSLNVTAVDTVSFRRIVTSGNCSNYSNVIKINVQKGIGNNSISAPQYICSNTVPSMLNGTEPNGADGSYSYQWQKSADNGQNWTVILSATQISYQPGELTQTTLFRRVVTSALCSGLQQSLSNAITIRVSPGPHARFTWTSDAACTPFIISDNTIGAEESEQGDTFEWFANGTKIGTGIEFPGYTLNAAGDSIEIKLQVSSALGCGSSVFAHIFSTNASLNADFTSDKANGCGPLMVKFNNTTLNTQGVTFKWDFGNGQFSALKDPAPVAFEGRTDGNDTTYTVTLNAVSNCVTSVKIMQVTVTGRAIALPVPDKTTGCSPLTVVFKNNTLGSSNTYTWDFGDGTAPFKTSSKENVSHTYISGSPQLYTAKLIAENECGKDESSYVIRVSPNTVYPRLTVNGNEYEGCAPHTVRFINNTTGASLYTYDFGDGSAVYTTNSLAAVPHTFTTGGTYTVRLTASNGCSDTAISQTITVRPQAITDFSADVTSGCRSLTVSFTNKTTGGASYAWDFGDGTTSEEVNPVHTYSSGTSSYRVRLTSTSPFGCPHILEKPNYITVYPPPAADFDVLPGNVINIPDYRFTFRNAGKGDIKTWNWDFGDRSPASSASDPEHTYPDTGSYKVRLIVISSQGCTDTLIQTVRISGIPGTLFVPNAFMPNSLTDELRSFKVKGSGIEKWHMRIFNNWGELIWQTETLDSRGVPAESWDGTIQGTQASQGVYFWEISATFKNGTEWAGMSYNNSEPKRTGAIHLIR